MRADECSGVFLASASSRRSHSDVSPCAKHRIPPREQAVTMRLSGRDEHHVMKAMAGEPGMRQVGKEPARANGDCGVDMVNSVTEGGEDFTKQILTRMQDPGASSIMGSIPALVSSRDCPSSNSVTHSSHSGHCDPSRGCAPANHSSAVAGSATFVQCPYLPWVCG